MERIDDLEKQAEAAESRDGAEEINADAGTDLADDELDAVSGGFRSRIDGRIVFKTYRVTNSAGAVIWDNAATPNERLHVGYYPAGTEFRARPLLYPCLVGNKSLFYYHALGEDGQSVGYIESKDVTAV